jgi:hypothetical protein
MNNPYIRYYVDQQQGRDMPVFRDSPWQAGYGQQIGYSLGSLFRSMARAVMPMVRSGAKALGNIAVKSGADFVGDVLAHRNVKEAAKARTATSYPGPLRGSEALVREAKALVNTGHVCPKILDIS